MLVLSLFSPHVSKTLDNREIFFPASLTHVRLLFIYLQKVFSWWVSRAARRLQCFLQWCDLVLYRLQCEGDARPSVWVPAEGIRYCSRERLARVSSWSWTQTGCSICFRLLVCVFYLFIFSFGITPLGWENNPTLPSSIHVILLSSLAAAATARCSFPDPASQLSSQA